MHAGRLQIAETFETKPYFMSKTRVVQLDSQDGW
jgi:hypothetical protein